MYNKIIEIAKSTMAKTVPAKRVPISLNEKS